MDKAEYLLRLEFAERVLTPLLLIKRSNWDAQAIVDLLAQLFSLAKNNKWLPDSSRGIGPQNAPFFDYYRERIGARIWQTTYTISAGRWTPARYEKLNFGEWPKPKIPNRLPQQKKMLGKFEITQGAQSPLRNANKISRSERMDNRRSWNLLYRQTIMLNKKPDAEIYEYEPYSTHVFRYERLIFRDYIWRAVVTGIDHSNLIEKILSPLYFSAMYNVRSILPRRISGQQLKKAIKDNTRIEILPLIDVCRFCGRPLQRWSGPRKVRSDAKFCRSRDCKSAFHRRNKAESLV